MRTERQRGIGGDINANINLNQAGNHVALGGANRGDVNGGPVIVAGTPDVSDLIAELVAESAASAAMAGNSSADTPHQNATIFDAAPDSAGGPFSSKLHRFVRQHQRRFGLNAHGVEEIIINIAGDGELDNNYGGSFTNASNDLISSIIRIFYDATLLTSNRLVWSSLLAPWTVVTLNQNLAGSLAAKSLVQRAEAFFPTAMVSSPLPVIPGPSMLLVFAGLGAAAISSKR
ncbi:hypothetical protein Mal64_30780 [Pseudobythopirellula maris]|uniref:Choice-of-anchor A domain-containing protein n=1 Tax=Pseudobythopirellula maris TaxID=2527991 RepID=A0A5C5ZKG5_9BACT|nr:collagen-binding domain-containing protein [Pseudobythopirellula maris]TWT87537.1 hypothetical protein Mal64_30780 [Pseudobythopirellula maris]